MNSWQPLDSQLYKRENDALSLSDGVFVKTNVDVFVRSKSVHSSRNPGLSASLSQRPVW